MAPMSAAASAFVALALSLVLTRALATRLASLVVDRPNERSLHEAPVPRTGGLAVLAAAAASLAFGGASLWLTLTLALILAAVSFRDDISQLPTGVRLAAHAAAAGVLVWYLFTPIAWVEAALLVLALAWITNLYNFMDGSDGLAGGMALIGFGAYAVAAVLAQAAPLAAVSAALGGAAAGFLVYNFHPARIFLGDVGAIPLGFLAGALGLAGWRYEYWPLSFPVLVFAPFIADATLTLARRLARRAPVWRAHREHYYQRLVLSGFGHRRTALVAYAAMLACAGAALAERTQPLSVRMACWAVALAVLGGVGAWIDVRWSRSRRAGATA